MIDADRLPPVAAEVGDVLRDRSRKTDDPVLDQEHQPRGGHRLDHGRRWKEISALEVELLGDGGLTYDDWSMRRTGSSDWARNAAYRYLRAKGNSIEGGTSEILRNIIAERVLGLPPEPRTDTKVPWKDLPR